VTRPIRTTGITEPCTDDSAFTPVRDNDDPQTTKRLCMAATPRIYIQESKVKSAQDEVTTDGRSRLSIAMAAWAPSSYPHDGGS
jgi:predicted helicase